MKKSMAALAAQAARGASKAWDWWLDGVLLGMILLSHVGIVCIAGGIAWLAFTSLLTGFYSFDDAFSKWQGLWWVWGPFGLSRFIRHGGYSHIRPR